MEAKMQNKDAKQKRYKYKEKIKKRKITFYIKKWENGNNKKENGNIIR